MDAAMRQILDLALLAYQAGNFGQAEKLFQTVVTASPLDPNPYNYLGLIYLQTNRSAAAANYFRHAIKLDPNNPLSFVKLAEALLHEKKFEEALFNANNALILDANLPDALLISGIALFSLGKLESSREQLQHFLAGNPNHVEGINILAEVMLQLKAFDEAERLLQKAITLSPTHISALLNLAACLLQTKGNEAAIEVYERILGINPNLLSVRFLLCMTKLLYIYKDEEEIASVRSRYEQELLALRDLSLKTSQEELSQSASWVGSMRPFLLPYQGKNDRKLQALYGELVSLFMTARYPQWERPLPLRKRTSSDRIRVGIVSGYFIHHSNWKTHLQGWIKHINRNEFALFGYHTANERDEVTQEARNYLERLTLGPKTFKEWCTTIREDNLDVLIFPEIGMNPMAMCLAALRLAPVQCTSWGHPNTSGLQTIDFFLSSELMEPVDGDAYYTEKLIRLPNLSIYYEPQTVSFNKRPRADFGLNEKAVLYWCCQVPLKYQPQYDEVFVKIALGVPQAQFVFVESVPMIAGQLRSRLENAFARFGLKASDYCVFLPKLNRQEFEEAASLMDIYLDSLGWSGCNSSLESLAHNLPIVTLPGATMRSQHTAAILNRMSMNDCIATTQEGFIAQAITLGCDPILRSQIAKRIAAQKELIYRDEKAIQGLENFLKSVVG